MALWLIHLDSGQRIMGKFFGLTTAIACILTIGFIHPFNCLSREAEQAAAAGTISWQIPEDGGTPRDPGRIVQLSPNEFRIHARAEEGSGPLKHAVSRMDLYCHNSGTEAQEVTIHVEVSGDGQRTIQNQNFWGDMDKRNFVYVQAPNRSWRRVDGTVNDWTCTVRFKAEVGDTKVGLGPWYTYGDYLRFVESLPDHPNLHKETIGTSDGGRTHWELTITDPNVPAEQKQRIFWHAREHAYETYSSFAIEGLVQWLLSPAGAEVCRRFVFSIHPMTNVDGVAQGNEYRGGYDYPDPRGTATAQLTFGAMDRLQPHFAIAWHNWITPRELDVVFYTDSVAGKATRRAWDLFTQHFPSPRSVGHRWENENNPLAKNWFGRELNESNVHQYAMKRYGTQVWGWEMPWWGRDDGDPIQFARKAGANFGRAFVTTLERIKSDPVPATSEVAKVTVPQWDIHEFELHGTAHVENPYRDAALIGEFTAPSGRIVTIEGFHDGEDIWRLRFAPDEKGSWQYLLRGEGVELYQRGGVQCVEPTGYGFIRIHPKNPYAFAHDNGTAFFPMGDTCYGLYDDTPITPTLRLQYLETRRRQHFNFVRMSIGHSAPRAAKDPNYWAWGGIPDKPNLDTFNPVFFRGLDELFLELKEQGMNVELLLLNFYRTPFTDTKLWTPARERLWLRYVTARYAAFNNLFLWTLSNEYETHPDGRYRLDRPGDVEWAKTAAQWVKQMDPYRHPVTVHPVVSSNTQGPSPRDPFEPPWRIGEFFGETDAIDVLSQQTASAYPTQWDEALGSWVGDVPGVSQSIAADRIYQKPVLNTESGYEYLKGYPTNKHQVHHTDKVRRAAWRIVCSGGYFAAGFISTIGHSDVWEIINPPHRYPFLVADSGAGDQLGFLYKFFTALPFWEMQPFPYVSGNAVALVQPNHIYVVYLPQGGEISLDLKDAPGPYSAQWFNPREGKLGEVFSTNGAASTEFIAPDLNDWVLLFQVLKG